MKRPQYTVSIRDLSGTIIDSPPTKIQEEQQPAVSANTLAKTWLFKVETAVVCSDCLQRAL